MLRTADSDLYYYVTAGQKINLPERKIETQISKPFRQSNVEGGKYVLSA
jgi:hypothetical protein